MPEQHIFADPSSIRILGAKQDDGGAIREADVLFHDEQDARCWYITIVIGSEYVADVIDAWRESEVTRDPAMGTPSDRHEPPKFVWNGGPLDDNGVAELISNAPLELLAPFLVQVPEEATESLIANHDNSRV